MKIAILAAYPVHLLPGFEGQSSGGHYATWLPQLSENFEALIQPADEIHWIVMSKLVDKRKAVIFNNQTFHLLPRKKLSLSIVSYFLFERRAIASALNEIGPDVVHGWGTEDVYGPAQADWKGASILSMQGILSHYWKISKGGCLARLLALYEPRTIRRSKVVTSESPWGRDQVKMISSQTRVELVEYGTDKKFFGIERRLSSAPTFLYVGSLDYRKGTDLLAEAFRDSRLQEVQLLVLGDGQMKPVMEECGGNVRVLGRVGPKKVMELLESCWALIHPTRADTSPNSVKEARVAGLAIITTKAGGQTQYVEDGVSGLFFDPEDVESLIEAILSFSADRESAREMGVHGLSSYQEMLQPARTAGEFYALYREMVLSS